MIAYRPDVFNDNPIAKYDNENHVTHATILAYPGCYASSVVGVIDAFYIANKVAAANRIPSPLSWTVVSDKVEPIVCSSNVGIWVDTTYPEIEETDVIVLAGPGHHPRFEDHVLDIADIFGSWLIEMHKKGVLIATSCAGAFVLARLGLLEGRRCSTTWWMSSKFRRHNPEVELATDEVVIESDGIVTGGSTAWQHMSLHLIEKFCGRPLAVDCSQILLMDINHPGQLAHSSIQLFSGHGDDVVLNAQNYIHRNAHRTIRIEDVANAVNVTTRTMARRFKKSLSITPNQYVQETRLQMSKQLLTSTTENLDVIVQRVGYQDTSTFRSLFSKRVGMTPSEFRARFGLQKAEA